MPLFACVTLVPLSVYLIAMGFRGLRRHPVVESGGRDFLWLGLSLSGFAAMGPLELFLPETAAFQFGPWVWLLMLILYVLLVVLWSMALRPSLIVHNVRIEELRPLLAEVSRQLDADARWGADTLVMPRLKVRLHLEPAPASRSVQIASTGSEQDHANWKRLAEALRSRLRDRVTERNPRAVHLIAAGSLCLAVVTTLLVRDYTAIAGALSEMLRM